MKIIKRGIFIINIMIALFMVFIINGVIESQNINKDIEAFKARGEFVYESRHTKYYAVKKAYEYEDTTRNIMSFYNERYLGAKADIFVTSRNPLEGSVLMGWISSLTWVGHTALVVDDNGEETIEIIGNGTKDENVVRIWPNTWITDDDGSPQIALLRIKKTTSSQRDDIINAAKRKLGYGYNYTFLFNRANSFYCSDFVSRSIASAGINVNYDYLATTGADMLVSDNTYLIYYREKIIEENETKYVVYFLTE